jgi:hypothetical protein
VEEAIHDAIEIGYDGFTIDGEFPSVAMFGVETKGKGYLGEVMTYTKLPKSILEVNDKLFPYLNEENFRGIFSCELRVKNDTYYFIDPCCRMPSPPGELYGVMISNWNDILWEGAAGTLVDPIYVAKFGATLVLKSDWVQDNWLPVSFPDSISEFVRLKNYCVIDDRIHVIPQMFPISIGSVVGIGDSADEAIRMALRNADKVEALDVYYDPDALCDSLAGLNEVNNG